MKIKLSIDALDNFVYFMEEFDVKEQFTSPSAWNENTLLDENTKPSTQFGQSRKRKAIDDDDDDDDDKTALKIPKKESHVQKIRLWRATLCSSGGDDDDDDDDDGELWMSDDHFCKHLAERESRWKMQMSSGKVKHLGVAPIGSIAPDSIKIATWVIAYHIVKSVEAIRENECYGCLHHLESQVDHLDGCAMGRFTKVLLYYDMHKGKIQTDVIARHCNAFVRKLDMNQEENQHCGLTEAMIEDTLDGVAKTYIDDLANQEAIQLPIALEYIMDDILEEEKNQVRG